MKASDSCKIQVLRLFFFSYYFFCHFKIISLLGINPLARVNRLGLFSSAFQSLNQIQSDPSRTYIRTRLLSRKG
jgi:hypothetical protein